MAQRVRSAPPTFIQGRKGGVSIVDAMVRALWVRSDADGKDDWPSLSLVDLQERASRALGYDVPSSSVRSSVYSHPDIFEKCTLAGAKVAYRLSPAARSRRA